MSFEQTLLCDAAEMKRLNQAAKDLALRASKNHIEMVELAQSALAEFQVEGIGMLTEEWTPPDSPPGFLQGNKVVLYALDPESPQEPLAIFIETQEKHSFKGDVLSYEYETTGKAIIDGVMMEVLPSKSIGASIS